MSNGGGEKLKWLYDLHLLAGAMDAAGWEPLRALAVDRGLAGVCVDALAEPTRSRLRWIWQRLHPTDHYREDVGVAGPGLLRDRIRRALRQLRR